MSRTQIQQGVVVLLLVAFGVIWTFSRQGTSSTQAGSPRAGTPIASPVSLPAPPPASPETPSSPPQAPEISRDLFLPPAPLQEQIIAKEKKAQTPPETPASPGQPVAPPIAPEIDLSQFELQGIFWGTAQPQAIINRQIVSVGDEIKGAKVSSISKNRVLLEMGGASTELKLLNKNMDNSERTP